VTHFLTGKFAKMKKDETAVRSTESLINNPMRVLFTCPHGGRVEFSPFRDDSNVTWIILE